MPAIIVKSAMKFTCLTIEMSPEFIEIIREVTNEIKNAEDAIILNDSSMD